MSRMEINRRNFLAKSVGAIGAASIVASPTTADKQNDEVPPSKILNYDERMEYRRLGKTNWMVSSVSLGGHWKRLNAEGPDFDKNRADVLAKCIDSGFNYVDACWLGETVAYAKAAKSIGKRDKIYFGFSSGVRELRFEKWRTKEALLKGFEDSLLEAKLEYADLWRLTCLEPGRMHTFGEVFEMIAAGEKAVKDGKCRAFGFSTHDRPWIEHMIKNFPIISAVCMPYTARSKRMPKGSLFESVVKYDVGILGIKPFASNSMFKGDSQPGNPHEKEDNERARMALRYILCNKSITSPIPGLINIPQVDNCLQAIAERREHDLQASVPGILEDKRFAQAADEMINRLPADYQWLRKWQWV